MMRRRGFSLLEVLIALVLVSLALVAIVRAAGIGGDAVGAQRSQLLASWVADNALVELELAEAFPPLGERVGRARMGPDQWHWRIVVQATDDPEIRRLDVSVYSDPARSRRVGGQSALVSRP